MTTETLRTYSTTGAQAALDIGPANVISYAMESENADAAVDVEVKLTETGSWKKETVGISEATVITTLGPVIGVRANITSLGTSSTVILEVLGISR